MRYNAKEEDWTPMEIKGIEGYFSPFRIDWETVPENFHCYELADGESDGNPCRYRSKEIGILVNFFGTFISKDELPLIEETKYEKKDVIGYIDSEDDWGFLDGEITFDEVLKEVEK